MLLNPHSTSVPFRIAPISDIPDIGIEDFISAPRHVTVGYLALLIDILDGYIAVELKPECVWRNVTLLFTHGLPLVIALQSASHTGVPSVSSSSDTGAS